MELSDEYIAGFFDGEGCISSNLTYTTGKYEKYPWVSVRISISNTARDVLEAIRDKYGGSVCSKGGGKNKNCFHLRICGKDKMYKFLIAIYPYCIIKKEQISIALEFIESLRSENLGNKPLPVEIHDMRQRVHNSLRKRKLPEMRFIN